MAAHELCGLMCLEGGLPGAYQGLRHLGHPASKVLRCSPRHVRPENLRSSNELARGGRIYSPSGSLSRPARCSGGSWSGSSRQGTGSTMSSQVSGRSLNSCPAWCYRRYGDPNGARSNLHNSSTRFHCALIIPLLGGKAQFWKSLRTSDLSQAQLHSLEEGQRVPCSGSWLRQIPIEGETPEVVGVAISRLIPKRRFPPSQTWRTFLANHVRDLVALDFFTVPTARLRVLFVLVVLAHHRRHVVHFSVTEHPTAPWTAQQIVNAFPDESAPALSPPRPDALPTTTRRVPTSRWTRTHPTPGRLSSP